MYRFVASFIEKIRAAHTATLATVAAGQLQHLAPKVEAEKSKFSPRAEKIAAICRMDWGDTHGPKIRTLCELITGEAIPEITRPKTDVEGTPRVDEKNLPLFSIVVPLEGKNASSHAYPVNQPICRLSIAGGVDTFTDKDGNDSAGGHVYYTGEVRLATKEEADTYLAALAAAKIPDRRVPVLARIGSIFEIIPEAVAAPAK